MNEKITELKHRLAKIESMKDYQRELEKRMDETTTNLTIAAKIVEKENQDVKKLHQLSLSSILAWFAKDQEERLQKEEHEALQAAIYLKQLQENQAALNDELVKCEEEIAKEDALRAALEQLQKEELLAGPQRDEVASIYADLEKEQLLDKELNEALEAGYMVGDKLRRSLEELESASAWGVMDIAGGGLISSMAKHAHVDTAQKQVAELQQDLYRFQKEVNDVEKTSISSVEMEGWLKMADIALDNFVFDFMALSRINNNHEKLKEGLQKITELQDHMLAETLASRERQQSLKEKLRLYQEKDEYDS